jgi:hypothetical protein
MVRLLWNLLLATEICIGCVPAQLMTVLTSWLAQSTMQQPDTAISMCNVALRPWIAVKPGECITQQMGSPLVSVSWGGHGAVTARSSCTLLNRGPPWTSHARVSGKIQRTENRLGVAWGVPA